MAYTKNNGLPYVALSRMLMGTHLITCAFKGQECWDFNSPGKYLFDWRSCMQFVRQWGDVTMLTD